MFYWGLEELFFRFSALLAAGFIATLVMTPLHQREREGLFLLLGVISVHLAGIAMQGKFFQYHYASTLPLVAFLAGLGLYKLWRRLLAGGAGGILAFVAFVVVAASMRTAVRDLGSFWERSIARISFALGQSPYESHELLDKRLSRVADYNLDANRQVAAELRHLVAEDRAIFVWGFEPGIYWLSERPLASHFIYDVAQRVPWARERARRELMAELERSKPAAIIVQHGDRFNWVTGDEDDSAQALVNFPELQGLIEREYRHEKTVEDFEIYLEQR
jgi:hypothetical protein